MQLQLPIRIPASRTLLPLEFVQVLLDIDEDQVLSLICSAALEYAWDIASRDADRREIRVWRESVSDYMTHDDGPRTPARVRVSASHQDDGPAYQAVLPSSRPDFRTTELARSWTASSTHIHQLVADGLIQENAEDRRTRPASGPNSYIKVTRASVISFLLSRRIT